MGIYAFCIIAVLSIDILFIAMFKSIYNLWFRNKTLKIVIPIKGIKL